MLKDLVYLGQCTDIDNSTSCAGILRASVTPRLQSLRIKSDYMDWSAFRHSNLRSLHIESTGPMKPENGSCEDLLDALEAMPCLEVLGLTDCFPSDLHTTPLGRRLIALPRLRSIDLNGFSFACANLLTFLSIPRKCRVSIDGAIRDIINVEATLAGVRSYMTSFNEHHSAQHMVVNHGYMQIVPYSPIYTDSSSFPTPSRVDEQTEFLIRCKGHGNVEDMLPLLSKILPLSQVVKLTLCGYINAFNPLKISFAHMPALQIFYIRDADNAYGLFTSRIFDVFRSVDQQPDSNEGTMVGTGRTKPLAPLPELKQLIFMFSPVFLRESVAKCMMSCLTKRRKRGFGPETVSILNLESISGQMVAVFRSIGWRDWDSYVNFALPAPEKDSTM